MWCAAACSDDPSTILGMWSHSNGLIDYDLSPDNTLLAFRSDGFDLMKSNLPFGEGGVYEVHRGTYQVNSETITLSVARSTCTGRAGTQLVFEYSQTDNDSLKLTDPKGTELYRRFPNRAIGGDPIGCFDEKEGFIECDNECRSALMNN
jgi:hypothetical protein